MNKETLSPKKENRMTLQDLHEAGDKVRRRRRQHRFAPRGDKTYWKKAVAEAEKEYEEAKAQYEKEAK